MKCVSCGLRAGYNRVVVDLVSGRELEGFCRNCEFDEFGQILSKSNHRADSCILCRRDGHYGLVVWRPYREESGHRIICDVEYSVGDRTPRLCDEHFHETCRDPTPAVCNVGGQQP